MRIGLFDPYLDTLGGGEKYILDIASYLSIKHEVFLFWEDKEILEKAKKRFDLDLSKIKVIENIFSKKKLFFEKILLAKKYDLIIYVSDGSFPLLLSKKNILLFQFPVNWVNGKSFFTKIKLKRINKIICYSDFVKRFLDETFQKDTIVVPPSIYISKNNNFNKENIILTVGRFTKALNTKKQDFLINVFKKMCQQGLKEWKFILIGSVLNEDKGLIEELKNKAKNYPISILSNISYQELENFYKKAKIYWHAAGYGEDLKKFPEKAEHFGISTVEAMNMGVVPIVIGAGGQKEIVEDKSSGFLWNTEEELINYTNEIISNDKLRKKIMEKAIKRADMFSREKFNEKIEEVLIK